MNAARPMPNAGLPPKGVVAMITVLIVMAVLLIVGLTISQVGQNGIVLSGVVSDGEQAFAVADACAEDAMEQLKANAAFSGSAFTLDGGTCASSVANLGGDTRQITATGGYANDIRIISANVTIKFNVAGDAEKIRINAWQEAQ